MRRAENELANLNKALRDIISHIKVYSNMDPDFEKLCADYEELTNAINHMERTDNGNNKVIINELIRYKQLQIELINDILYFIKEEQN